MDKVKGHCRALEWWVSAKQSKQILMFITSNPSYNALHFPCSALTAEQHVTGHWWSDEYRYWYWVLVSVAKSIGYWVLGSFFGIALILALSLAVAALWNGRLTPQHAFHLPVLPSHALPYTEENRLMQHWRMLVISCHWCQYSVCSNPHSGHYGKVGVNLALFTAFWIYERIWQHLVYFALCCRCYCCCKTKGVASEYQWFWRERHHWTWTLRWNSSGTWT